MKEKGSKISNFIKKVDNMKKAKKILKVILYILIALVILVAIAIPDRKSVVQGKSVDLGGRRIIKKKNKKK